MWQVEASVICGALGSWRWLADGKRWRKQSCALVGLAGVLLRELRRGFQDAVRRRLLSAVAAAVDAAALPLRLAASAIRQQHVRLERHRSCSSAVSGGVFIKQKT